MIVEINENLKIDERPDKIELLWHDKKKDEYYYAEVCDKDDIYIIKNQVNKQEYEYNLCCIDDEYYLVIEKDVGYTKIEVVKFVMKSVSVLRSYPMMLEIEKLKKGNQLLQQQMSDTLALFRQIGNMCDKYYLEIVFKDIISENDCCHSSASLKFLLCVEKNQISSIETKYCDFNPLKEKEQHKCVGFHRNLWCYADILALNKINNKWILKHISKRCTYLCNCSDNQYYVNFSKDWIICKNGVLKIILRKKLHKCKFFLERYEHDVGDECEEYEVLRDDLSFCEVGIYKKIFL